MKMIFVTTFFMIFLIFLTFLISSFSLMGIVIAQQQQATQITIACDPCIVKNCQCVIGCNTGKMYVYASSGCAGTENSIIDFSDHSAQFYSVQPGQFYARADCADNGQVSSCQPIYVSAYLGQTATTTAAATPTTPTTTQTQQTQQTTTPTTLTTTTQTKITTATTTATRKENSAPVSTDTILVIVLLAVVLVVVVGLLFYYKKATES